MKQKTTWLLFLAIGIGSTVFNCGNKQIEYRLETDFSYVNKTDKALSFLISHPNAGKKKLVIPPNSTSEIITVNASGGYENPNPSNCCEGILEGILGGSGVKDIELKIDTTVCLLKTPGDINNYNAEIIADRHYKYTFTFTDKVLEVCK